MANDDMSDQPSQVVGQTGWRARAQKPLLIAAIVVIVGASVVIWRQAESMAQRRGGGNARVLAQGRPTFDMTGALIPTDRIMHGGPPKDGIPALTDAKFITAASASFLTPTDRVIGVAVGSEAKAYPLKMLDRHEAVNDRLGGKSFAVTYCPLCDSSAVFDRRVGDQELEFGISGLLYNSNVLLYDRAKSGRESLWSQMASSAVAGVKSGQALRRLPLEVTSWSDWRERHPTTLVLSTETGHARNYDHRAYGEYFTSPRLMFPVEPLDGRMAAKTPVLGVISGKTARAYPLEAFAAKPGERVVDSIDGRQLTLIYDGRHNSLRVEQADEGLEWMYSFWFAWAAFYPETDIYRP